MQPVPPLPPFPMALPGSQVKAVGKQNKCLLPKPPKPPANLERVCVSCNGVKATFVIATQMIVCKCPTCVQSAMEAGSIESWASSGSRTMSPTEFERHSGMSASKKWRRSIKVEFSSGGRDASMSLGRWLEQNGFKSTSEEEKEKVPGSMPGDSKNNHMSCEPMLMAPGMPPGMQPNYPQQMIGGAMGMQGLQGLQPQPVYGMPSMPPGSSRSNGGSASNHGSSKSMKRSMQQQMAGSNGLMMSLNGQPMQHMSNANGMMMAMGSMQGMQGYYHPQVPGMQGGAGIMQHANGDMGPYGLTGDGPNMASSADCNGNASTGRVDSRDDEDMMAADALALLKHNDAGEEATAPSSAGKRRSTQHQAHSRAPPTKLRLHPADRRPASSSTPFATLGPATSTPAITPAISAQAETAHSAGAASNEHVDYGQETASDTPDRDTSHPTPAQPVPISEAAFALAGNGAAVLPLDNSQVAALQSPNDLALIALPASQAPQPTIRPLNLANQSQQQTARRNMVAPAVVEATAAAEPDDSVAVFSFAPPQREPLYSGAPEPEPVESEPGDEDMTENLLSHHEHRAASSHRVLPVAKPPVITVVQGGGSGAPSMGPWAAQRHATENHPNHVKVTVEGESDDGNPNQNYSEQQQQEQPGQRPGLAPRGGRFGSKQLLGGKHESEYQDPSPKSLHRSSGGRTEEVNLLQHHTAGKKHVGKDSWGKDLLAKSQWGSGGRQQNARVEERPRPQDREMESFKGTEDDGGNDGYRQSMDGQEYDDGMELQPRRQRGDMKKRKKGGSGMIHGGYPGMPGMQGGMYPGMRPMHMMMYPGGYVMPPHMVQQQSMMMYPGMAPGMMHPGMHAGMMAAPPPHHGMMQPHPMMQRMYSGGGSSRGMHYPGGPMPMGPMMMPGAPHAMAMPGYSMQHGMGGYEEGARDEEAEEQGSMQEGGKGMQHGGGHPGSGFAVGGYPSSSYPAGSYPGSAYGGATEREQGENQGGEVDGEAQEVQIARRRGPRSRRERRATTTTETTVSEGQQQSGYDVDVDSGDDAHPDEPMQMAGPRRMRRPMTSKKLQGALQPMIISEAIDLPNGDLDLRAHCPYGEFAGVLALAM